MTIEEIMNAVKTHHEHVMNHGHIVLMTSLIGSQNYNLATSKSDIDTFSLTLPSFEDLMKGKEPETGVIPTDDGFCNYKDIRIALDLLQKTSPNSVEYFTSKFIYYNHVYASILQQYLKNDFILWMMTHCNYGHMLNAIAGMAHQLTKRNMPAGKRFSHALRLKNMYWQFINSDYSYPQKVLSFMNREDWAAALEAKTSNATFMEEEYNNKCNEISRQLDIWKDEFEKTEEQEQIETFGLSLIEDLRYKLFTQYFREIVAHAD